MTPALITRASLAATAAKRWMSIHVAYGRCSGDGEVTWFWSGAPKSKAIHAQLLALGPTPNPDDVDRIMGDPVWTEAPACEACERAWPAVVRIAEPVARHLCLECVKARGDVGPVTVANARLSFDDAADVTAEPVDLIPVKIGDIL